MTQKQRKIEALIHDVWRQNPRCGMHSTYNPCETPGCEEGARGTGLCGACVVKELAKLTGAEAAQSYVVQVALIRAAEWKMLNGGKRKLEDDPFFDADHLKEVQEYMNKQHPSK